MTKYITIGKFNKNYKYFLLHIFFSLLNEFLFLPSDIKFFSENKFTQSIINYLGTFIISIIFLRYEIYQRKHMMQATNEKIEPIKTLRAIPLHTINDEKTHEKILFNETDLKGKISTLKIMLIAFLFVLQVQLMNVYHSLGLSGIDYWMFELLFISFLMQEKLGISLDIHKKFSIYFILIFSTIFKFLSSVMIFKDEDMEKIYKEHIFVIPLAIISYIFITFLRSYVNYQLKYFFDLRYVSIYGFLVFFSLIGVIICSIFCIIATNIECTKSSDLSDFIEDICQVHIVNDDNSKDYYYDKFSTYFEKLKSKGSNFIFLILKIIISFLTNLFPLLIIQKLEPVYYICTNSLFYFILQILGLFDGIEVYSIFEIIAEIFAIIGISIYLELIELNFFGLNHDLKKNIIERSIEDLSLNDKKRTSSTDSGDIPFV